MSRGQVTPYSSSGTALTINRELPLPGQVKWVGGETRAACNLNCGYNCNRLNVIIKENAE